MPSQERSLVNAHLHCISDEIIFENLLLPRASIFNFRKGEGSRFPWSQRCLRKIVTLRLRARRKSPFKTTGGKTGHEAAFYVVTYLEITVGASWKSDVFLIHQVLLDDHEAILRGQKTGHYRYQHKDAFWSCFAYWDEGQHGRVALSDFSKVSTNMNSTLSCMFLPLVIPIGKWQKLTILSFSRVRGLRVVNVFFSSY